MVDSAREFVVEKKSDKKRYLDKSIYHRVYAIKKYLEYLGLDINWIDREFRKTVFLSEREHIETITYSQVVQLMDEFELAEERELKILIALMYDTGARIRSLLKLETKNVQEDEGDLLIYITEKRGKKEKKFMSKNTARLLQQFKKDAESKNRKYIFMDKDRPSVYDLNAKYYQIWTKLKNMSRKVLGIDMGVSPHWFRRGGAMEIYKKDKSLIKAQKFLGHTSLDSTRRYLMADAEELRSVITSKKRDW